MKKTLLLITLLSQIFLFSQVPGRYWSEAAQITGFDLDYGFQSIEDQKMIIPYFSCFLYLMKTRETDNYSIQHQ